MKINPTLLRTLSTSKNVLQKPMFGSQSCRMKLGLHARIVAVLVCVLLLLAVCSADAQTIRFRAGQVRVTVPINSGDSTTITNQVNLTGVTNADLSVSGLPDGASAVLTDTNGVA